MNVCPLSSGLGADVTWVHCSVGKGTNFFRKRKSGSWVGGGWEVGGSGWGLTDYFLTKGDIRPMMPLWFFKVV